MQDRLSVHRHTWNWCARRPPRSRTFMPLGLDHARWELHALRRLIIRFFPIFSFPRSTFMLVLFLKALQVSV